MTDVKWVKLKVGMFDGVSFRRIKRAKIGGESFRDKLTAVWFELLDFAGKCNHGGAFIDSHEIPFVDLDDIATMIDREPDELKLCMNFYINEGMVEIIDDVYRLSNWAQYQNEEGLAKIREKKRIAQAKWRASKKALPEGTHEPPEGEEEPGENVDGVDSDVESTVESTNNLPSYSYSYSLSTSTREDKEGCGEERKGTKKGAKKGQKPIKQPDFDFSTTNFSPALIAAVEKWIQYKTERRDEYKPTGLQSLMTQIQKNVDQHGEQAVIDLIGECMAQNYKGIIFDKLKNKNGGGQNVPAKSVPAGKRYGTCV